MFPATMGRNKSVPKEDGIHEKKQLKYCLTDGLSGKKSISSTNMWVSKNCKIKWVKKVNGRILLLYVNFIIIK